MKKLFSTLTAILLFYFSIIAQITQHKIVFDFVKADTADFSVMIRQINNILKEAADTKVEVVCSGPGIFMLVDNKTNVRKEIEKLQSGFNVSFAVCANTMRNKNVDKSRLLPQAIVVPVAILEISSREQEGWSYIKAGHNPYP